MWRRPLEPARTAPDRAGTRETTDGGLMMPFSDPAPSQSWKMKMNFRFNSWKCRHCNLSTITIQLEMAQLPWQEIVISMKDASFRSFSLLYCNLPYHRYIHDRVLHNIELYQKHVPPTRGAACSSATSTWRRVFQAARTRAARAGWKFERPVPDAC